MNADTKLAFVPHSETSRTLLLPVRSFDTPPHTHAKLDQCGIWLSALCAVHCMVMPVILIAFPVMTWIHWSRIMDAIALGVAAVFGLGGCLLGLRHHRNAVPLCLVFVGLTVNTSGRFAAPHLGPFLSQTLIIAGPMVMAYGLWRDRRLCKCRGHAR